MTFADWIKNQRKARNWTQGELADKLGMHVKAVTTWEIGKGKPNRNTVKRIATLFDYLPEVLVQAVFDKRGKLPPPEKRQGELVIDPMTAARIRQLANRSALDPMDWLDKLIASMEQQAQSARELLPDIAGKIGIKDGNRIAAKPDDPKQRRP